MSAEDNGGPAFPIPGAHMPNGEWMWGDNGMTLRDYFAGKALEGMLADSEVRGTPKEFAERSYALADAMLEARK